MTESKKVHQATSQFAHKLATNPVLATRCEQVVTALREAAREEVEACERADMISPIDLRVIINA